MEGKGENNQQVGGDNAARDQLQQHQWLADQTLQQHQLYTGALSDLQECQAKLAKTLEDGLILQMEVSTMMVDLITFTEIMILKNWTDEDLELIVDKDQDTPAQE